MFNMKKEVGFKRQRELFCVWFGIIVALLLLNQCYVSSARWDPSNKSQYITSSPPVRLRMLDKHVVMSNGLVSVTLSNPIGMVTEIEYGGINNLLERNKEKNRGYWDVVWSDPNHPRNFLFQFDGTQFRVIVENENHVEVSFSRTWDGGDGFPLNSDKRYVMLRGCPGLYTYNILERPKGWPDVDVIQSRLAFKLQDRLFHYMAISDDRQKIMPSPWDRQMGTPLAYGEAVLLTKSENPSLIGQVDDKYQFSFDNKDNRVHGWISSNPHVGFWVILPSDESRSGGPLKQELSSHTGPTTLATFFSGHYAGPDLNMKLRNGEPFKKVYGPVFVYLNKASQNDDHQKLWTDAKEQLAIETRSWPYDFALSKDHPHPDQRGTVTGRLLVRDRYINHRSMSASSAYVGLAPPGAAGSWQRDTKGYQYWNKTNDGGYFFIRGIRPGTYNLYAWVPGFIGDFRYNADVTITPGGEIKLDDLVYEPPRNGPTLWEIGIPDRTAAEFYVPDPKHSLRTQLTLRSNNLQKFRQYGLWERYTDKYPNEDLVYDVGRSNYRTDWFFAHVNRKVGNNTYEPTTWRIDFDLENVAPRGTYTFRLALASANQARLQGWVNNQNKRRPDFMLGLTGRDNAIARHGIHGLYWLYSFDIPGYQFQTGRNTIFLRQSIGSNPFSGFMYDYLRLEGPPHLG
ncbi:hypothetical protein LguiB_026602 [Lonicera macranthoides]